MDSTGGVEENGSDERPPNGSERGWERVSGNVSVNDESSGSVNAFVDNLLLPSNTDTLGNYHHAHS